MNRRHFLQTSAGALLGTSASTAHGGLRTNPTWPLVVFEKPIQNLGYEAMGEALNHMGVHGIEATVRKNGHIKPERAEEEVPKMVAALAENEQLAVIAATDITEATEENARLMKILKANGIPFYRMGHLKYDLENDPLPQVREFRKQCAELAELSGEIGVAGLYQLHSGSGYVGAMSWDAALLLEDIDPAELGLAYDLRHFRTDSGSSWKTALAVAKKHICAIYVKDAKWTGERSDTMVNVPLDTGYVSEEIFEAVRKVLPPVPLSIHMEWGDAQIFPGERVNEAIAKIAREVKTLRDWL